MAVRDEFFEVTLITGADVEELSYSGVVEDEARIATKWEEQGSRNSDWIRLWRTINEPVTRKSQKGFESEAMLMSSCIQCVEHASKKVMNIVQTIPVSLIRSHAITIYR